MSVFRCWACLAVTVKWIFWVGISVIREILSVNLHISNDLIEIFESAFQLLNILSLQELRCIIAIFGSHPVSSFFFERFMYYNCVS